MIPNPNDETLKTLLTNARRIAVVGISDKPDRASYRVARYRLCNLFSVNFRGVGHDAGVTG